MWQKTLCNGKVTFEVEIYQMVTGRYAFRLLHKNGKTEHLANMPIFEKFGEALAYISRRPEWVEK